MKNLKNLIRITLISMIVFYGCKPDEEGGVSPDKVVEAPSPDEFHALQSDAISRLKQEAKFEATEGITFQSEKGTRLRINPDALSLNGGLVSGEVELEFVEAYEAADMLISNKPTMGIKQDGSKALLISGGVFYINLTQDGKQLDLNHTMQLTVPSSLTGGIDTEMILWTGVIDENENLAWEEKKQGADGRNNMFFEMDEYVSFISDLGWTNVDRFYNDPRDKTTLEVIVPDGYNLGNCSVYLYYDGEPNALAQLDTFNEVNNSLSEHYGQIPVGLEMHVIFVTEQEGQWKYGIQPQTVSDGDVYTFEEDDFIMTTESGIYDVIANLP